ncbi:MAG: MmgE/PrpD family protein [Candidatus Bathyarchaeota archaeon]|nr:MmgE/PrpD family protein [Candidatus Bathyarchaeota archaeon]
MQYSRIYAEYITKLQYRDLPPEVVEKAKMHFLDALGNILGAHEMPWSQMVVKLVTQMKGIPESTVMGEPDKYPMINAALANGTMAHGIDADDSGARPSWAHPGACIIPAAFAAAEAENVTGEELITALVAGYEISCRVDSAVYPGLRNRGFHATGVIGTIGAVAAAGKILGLNMEQMINAFGLAGIQAAGLEEWLTAGDMSKRLHAGKAAMNGLLAALLAREGYTGPASVFEGKYGLLNTHAEEYYPERLTEGLGSEYKLLKCKFKPYACCHELCPPIRMTMELKEKHGIKPEDVEKIRIGLNHITAENQLKVAETPLHAQNHPAVAVAIALVEDQVFMKEFFECYTDPRVVELGEKAEVYTDEDIDAVFPTKIGTRLEITTKNGETYTLFEEDKPPIPPEFIKEKFTVFASMTLPKDKVQAILSHVENLETLKSLEGLSKNLA